MRGGDAAEGDRQDEPEDGDNHAQRPAVTLLPLAPLVLLVAQPLGRTFARLVRERMLARCHFYRLVLHVVRESFSLFFADIESGVNLLSVRKAF